MVHFSCPCLNVRVHGRGATPALQEVTDVILSNETAKDSFFSPDVLVVTIDICGVTKAQNSLCRDRTVDGWTITSCFCCKFDVCATHADELYRVLVNSTAKKDDAINDLMQSNRYSRLFQMILPDINDNFIQHNLGIELQNSNLDSHIQHIQKLVTNYLKNEQKEMENRVRKFAEAEQESYAFISQLITKQKKAIIYLLTTAKEFEASEQNVVSDSPLIPGKDAKDSCEGKKKKSVYSEIYLCNPSIKSTCDEVFQRCDEPQCYGRSKKQSGRTLRRTLSTPADSHKLKKEPRHPPVSVDVGGNLSYSNSPVVDVGGNLSYSNNPVVDGGGVFDMDELDSKEDEKEEFSDSDTWGSASDSGNLEEDSNVETSKDDVMSKGDVMCASSLPMSIPAFSHYSHTSNMDEEEEDFKTPLPKNAEEIGDSIRALACSVTDGTEMFGELPRRRLNTGELLSSRPL